MTLRELELEINKFYLESEKDSAGERQQGIYPNSIILTKEQYNNFLKELFNINSDILSSIHEDVIIQSICGLKVIFTSYIEKPRVIYMYKEK